MDNIMGGLTLWLLLCCFAFFLTLIIHLLWDGRRSRILRSAAEMLVLLVLTQILMDHIKYHNRAFIEKPAVLLLTSIVMTGIAALEMQSCIRATANCWKTKLSAPLWIRRSPFMSPMCCAMPREILRISLSKKQRTAM